MTRTAHIDSFARNNLPPREQWPEFIFELPELQYPERMNAAALLLDRAVAAGQGDSPVIWTSVNGNPVHATYSQLLARANVQLSL